jgi:hypothetical protein
LQQITEANVGKQLAILLDDQLMSNADVSKADGWRRNEFTGDFNQQDKPPIWRNFLALGEIPARCSGSAGRHCFRDMGLSQITSSRSGLAVDIGVAGRSVVVACLSDCGMREPCHCDYG